MEYFVMKTDERLRRLPQLEIPGNFSGEKQKSVSILYVKEQHGLRVDYADYLDAQLPLISEKFQRILQKYQQDIRLQRVMLIEKGTGRQMPYCLVGAPEIVCTDKTETHAGAEGIKTLVIAKEEIGDRRIFFRKVKEREASAGWIRHSGESFAAGSKRNLVCACQTFRRRAAVWLMRKERTESRSKTSRMWCGEQGCAAPAARM